MAGSLDGGGGDEPEEVHEINATPLIDVMLVLLVVFMVAAPLATVDVAVELPASTAAPQPRPDAPLHLTLHEDLSLALGGVPVARAALGAALDAAAGGGEARVFLQADRSVDYGALMAVLDLLREAGHQRVALVGLEAPPGAGP